MRTGTATNSRPILAFLLFLISASLLVTEAFAAPRAKKKGTELLTVEVTSRQDLTRVYMNLSSRPEYAVESLEGDTVLRIRLAGAVLSPGISRLVPAGDERVTSIGVDEASGAAVVNIRKGSGLTHDISVEEKGTYILAVTVRGEPRAAQEKKEEDSGAVSGARVGGYFKNETAYRLSNPGQLSKVRNILYLESTGQLTDAISYKTSGRAYHDAVFDLTNNYPADVEEDLGRDAQIRDFYADFSMGAWDLRAGKQQIVWGEAVGLFFADVVNAKDLREFVLQDFDYIRKPQWAADIEYTRERFHLELVWSPFPEFNDFGLPGSEFPQAVPAPAGTVTLFNGTEEPSASISASEVGGRVSYLSDGWDFSLFHLYTWDKFPANLRTVVAPGVYLFTPEHKRINITGATFAKERGGVVFKGEFVYYQGKRFSVLDETDVDGVVEKDYLDYLLGVDYTFFEKVDFNFQFMQRVIFGFDDDIFREERVRTSASVWFKTGFLDNRLEPELLVISSLEELDMLLRAKLNYKFRGSWQARIGLDVFDGPDDGIFGQYSSSDRVYAEVRYDF